MPAPPQFKDLGKKAKDLFKKEYDYKNQIKVISKASGVKLESVGVAGKALVGSTKANWTDEYLGAIEVEAHSSGVAKGQFKLCGVTDGVDVTVAGAAAGSLSAEATYKQGIVSAMAKATHNLTKGCTALTASGVLGLDGVAVGGQVDLDAGGALKDYNVGAEYSSKDLVAALVTSNKGDDITVSFFQKVSGATTLGASLLVRPEAGTQLYTFGTDHMLDAGTQLKIKADSAGVVGAAVTHVLADPKLKLGVSAQFNALAADAFKAQKVGLAFTFGEF